jgi:nucleotide sugar dehydrogenase
LESTVNPGVCDELVLPLLEEQTGLKGGVDFYLAHCPERINPGDKNWNVTNIPRVVGGLGQASLDKAVAFYTSIISAPIKPMASLKEAEAVKVVENSFRNLNIAFVNELAVSFAKLGIDVVKVIDGASTKPYAFMAHYPACGIGGHCIPVDPYYLIDYSKRKSGFDHPLLSLACKTNEAMPEYTVSLVESGLQQSGQSLEGEKVAVLGLAYKADIDDCRESPAFEIIQSLRNKKAQVVSYDPHVPDQSDVTSLEAALESAVAVVVATNHQEFKHLRGSDFANYGVKVVVDGKNCLDKADIQAAGLHYRGMGR